VWCSVKKLYLGPEDPVIRLRTCTTVGRCNPQ